MENKITDLIENALKCEDYELRINFLVCASCPMNLMTRRIKNANPPFI